MQNHGQILAVDFEVKDDTVIKGKPTLFGLGDSLRMGLVNFDNGCVYLSKNQGRRDQNLSQVNDIQPSTLRAGKTTKEDLVTAFSDNFEGMGDIDAPVHLEVDPNIRPHHAPVHRIPVSKRDAVKAKLDEMVQAGKLKKTEVPTDWCSNMTIVEKQRPEGSTKLRICLDPSQTVNKAIVIPRYQIPTVAELLPRLSGHKHKTFSIFDVLDGFTQVSRDEWVHPSTPG